MSFYDNDNDSSTIITVLVHCDDGINKEAAKTTANKKSQKKIIAYVEREFPRE